MSNKIKFNIEIEVEGKDAERILKKLSQLDNALSTKSSTTASIPNTPTLKKAKVKKPTSKKPRQRSKRLSDKKFIYLWECSSSLTEFVSQSGMKRTSASVRASNMRKQGVPLKRFA